MRQPKTRKVNGAIMLKDGNATMEDVESEYWSVCLFVQQGLKEARVDDDKFVVYVDMQVRSCWSGELSQIALQLKKNHFSPREDP